MLSLLTKTPQPVVHDPGTALSTLEAEEYKTVSKEIGYGAPHAQAVDLETWMDGKSGNYSAPEVNQFLRRKCPLGQVWCWKALRLADRDRMSRQLRFGPEKHGDLVHGVYGRNVPLVALLLVRDIERAFPDRFAFFVSDYATRVRKQPDPFLMAVDRTYPAGSIHIILHWDEPGFAPSRRESSGQS